MLLLAGVADRSPSLEHWDPGQSIPENGAIHRNHPGVTFESSDSSGHETKVGLNVFSYKRKSVSTPPFVLIFFLFHHEPVGVSFFKVTRY